MNTTDLLTTRLSPTTAPANFLDTGGKATAATITAAFRLLLADARVRAILVNIFGGLTRCDMIAEGIVLAFRELRVATPVVVRLRGTEEERGRMVLRDAGLPIYAVADFEKAVRLVGELAVARV